MAEAEPQGGDFRRCLGKRGTEAPLRLRRPQSWRVRQT